MFNGPYICNTNLSPQCVFALDYPWWQFIYCDNLYRRAYPCEEWCSRSGLSAPITFPREESIPTVVIVLNFYSSLFVNLEHHCLLIFFSWWHVFGIGEFLLWKLDGVLRLIYDMPYEKACFKSHIIFFPIKKWCLLKTRCPKTNIDMPLPNYVLFLLLDFLFERWVVPKLISFMVWKAMWGGIGNPWSFNKGICMQLTW